MSYSTDFLNTQSGIIILDVPDVTGGPRTTIKGILQEDPQIQLGNNWGTLSEFDQMLDPLAQIEQAVGAETISNYISATGMAWKGTPHIKVNVNFYLVSFSQNSMIRYKAEILSKLCSVYATGVADVKVHGGYKLDYFTDNTNRSLSTMKDITNQSTGTVKLTFNSKNHTVISNLLIQSLNVQPSTVSVRDGSPLYYVISAGFTGFRAPKTTDIEEMFGGG